MEILIKKNPPIFTYKPIPTVFKNEYERQKYWANEKKKGLEGVDHLPPTFYHYLQHQKIKDRVSGKTIRPIPRESDLWIHEEVRECMRLKQPSCIIKCRGIGLSTLGGSLANYFMRFYAGSTSLVTSADQSRISKLYTDKIKVTNENYHPDIKYVVSKYNSTQSKTYLQLEVKHLDDAGLETISYSDIFCNQTNNSDEDAASFSGTGAKFGFYDELALNKRRKMLLQSSVECYRNQLTGELDGFLLAGGTCEAVLTNEELYEFKKLIEEADAYQMRVTFIPYWWRFADENGYVDQKKGEVWWNKEYERLDKLEDRSHIKAFLKNNPRTEKDIFDLADGAYFEEDVMEKIKLTLDTCKNEEVPHSVIMRGDAVEAKPEKTGKIIIVEHPKEGVDYFMTVDGVAAGSNSGSGESKVASIMWKGFDPNGTSYCPVAFYYEQPRTIEMSYIYSVNMCQYYNKFGNFKKIAAEGNAATGDHLSTYLEKEGLKKWIMFRKDLSGKGHSNTKKFFQYVTNDVRDWQIKQFNMILRKYVHNFQSKTILRDYLKGIEDNADLRDSSLMVTIYLGADFDKVVEKPKPKTRSRPTIVTGANGKTSLVWKTFQTEQKEENQVQEEEIKHKTTIPKFKDLKK